MGTAPPSPAEPTNDCRIYFDRRSQVARKTLALAALAAGMLAGTMGTAAAQYYDPGYRDYPLSRDYDGPRPYYRGYQREGYYRPGRYRTWNGCQPGWTVQDGLCKPYRGY